MSQKYDKMGAQGDAFCIHAEACVLPKGGVLRGFSDEDAGFRDVRAAKGCRVWA